MRIYEKRNTKSPIRCGYCLTEGHNKRHCPTMEWHWKANAHLHEQSHISISDNIVGVDNTMFPQQWRHYYGDSESLRQFRTNWGYIKERFTVSEQIEKKTRKKASCGFCGDTTHTRRNCEMLKTFAYILNETNKAYRSEFYDRYIEGVGLGVGALVKMRSGDMGIITELDQSSIMFSNLISRWNDYHTTMRITIMIGTTGIKRTYALGSGFFVRHEDDNEDHGIWNIFHGPFGKVAEVTSPAPSRPTKEWFAGQEPCFDYIMKKRSLNDLTHSFQRYIREFYPHGDLRDRLGDELHNAYFSR